MERVEEIRGRVGGGEIEVVTFWDWLADCGGQGGLGRVSFFY